MRIEASGPRPADDTWEQYTRTAAWPEWAPQIRDVRGVTGHITPGARGVVHGPFPVRVPFTIVSVDPVGRRWTWRVGIGPLSVVLDHGVDADTATGGGTTGGDTTADGTTGGGTPGGSTAWAVVHAPRLLVRAYAPLARLALRRLVGG